MRARLLILVKLPALKGGGSAPHKAQHVANSQYAALFYLARWMLPGGKKHNLIVDVRISGLTGVALPIAVADGRARQKFFPLPDSCAARDR